MSKPYKIILIVLVIAVVGIGLWSGVKYLWWFTPAYSQRQTVQKFFSDAASGNTSASYKLTSSTFQSDNSLTEIQSNLNVFSGDKLKITYLTYSKQKNGGMVVVGSVNDTTTSRVSHFLINVVNNKIDSLNVVSYPS